MKKRDQLENFINDNRGQFDDLKASTESWDKISQQLDHNDERDRSPGVLWIFKRAAAAVIIVFAMYGAYNLVIRVAQNNAPVAETKEVSPVIIEYNEAQAFYTSQVESKIAELERISRDHPEIIREVQEEFEVLDSDMNTMKSDLNEGVAQKEILEEMVQNYRLKLKILENILDQINANKTDKNSENETNTIET